MTRFNQTPSPYSDMSPFNETLHREAYLNSYVQQLIEEYSKGNHDTIDFHREYLSSLMEIFKDLEVIDPSGKIHDDIEVIHGTSERAIAKIKEDRNLRIPIISVVSNDLEIAIERRRPDFNTVIERMYDPKTRKAYRVISLSPKAVNVNFRVNIFDRYVENLNQLIEQIEMKFNPYALVKTKFGESTYAYLTDWSDQSIPVAGDRQNRLLMKSCLISLEAYMPTKKYLMTASDKIHELGNDDSVAVITKSIEESGNVESLTKSPNAVAYTDREFVMSDGFSMFYDLYIPTDTASPTVPLVMTHAATASWRKSGEPSLSFIDGTSEADPTSLKEELLSNGYAVLSFDVRGQARPWKISAAGGKQNSFFQPKNTQYAVSAEFGAENFCVRELLDIFELKDYVVGNFSAIDDNVGITGGSLGGIGTSMAAAWSGKEVPYNAIVSSQNAFLKAGASAIPNLSGTWGYNSGDTFSTFKAASVGSVIGDIAKLTQPQGPRSPYLSGPLRVYSLNSYSPREYDLVDAALRSDNIGQYTNEILDRNNFAEEISSTTVPVLAQLSIDDRQRGVGLYFDDFESIPTDKYMFMSTGHHDSPENDEALLKRNTNTLNWMGKYLKGESNDFPLDYMYEIMETPNSVSAYNDPKDLRTYRKFNTLKPSSISEIDLVLSLSGTNRVLIPGQVSSVSSLTTGNEDIKHRVASLSPAHSTSEFIDQVIQYRGDSDFLATDLKGVMFNDVSVPFLSVSAFTEDQIFIGSPSGVFTASADASGQFAYDVLDYDPLEPLSVNNPRTISMGSVTWHTPSLNSSSVSGEGRYQFYKFAEGHYIGIRLKNHTYFDAAVDDKTTMTFQTIPFFTDFNLQFDLRNGRCSVRVPLADYSTLPK